MLGTIRKARDPPSSCVACPAGPNHSVEGSSADALQRARLDDPRGSPDDPKRRLYEHMGCAIEDYEGAIAARSQGLVRGRTAWNVGRECWLVDFPLVVLVVNRSYERPSWSSCWGAAEAEGRSPELREGPPTKARMRSNKK